MEFGLREASGPAREVFAELVQSTTAATRYALDKPGRQGTGHRVIEMAKSGYTLFFTADDDVWSSESSFSFLFEFLGHRPLPGSRIRVEAGSPVSRESTLVGMQRCGRTSENILNI